MRASSALIASLMLAVSHAATVVASEIDVLEWTLRTDTALTGVGFGTDGRVQTVVTNPLSQTYFASLGNSTADSTINAHWDTAGFFDFFLSGDYADQGSPHGYSRSTGSVLFRPAVDSILTVDAEFNYALGGGDREAELRLNIGGGPAPGSVLFFQSRWATLIGGSDPNGTFNINAEVPMLAGELYGFSYRLELLSFGGSPTNLSTGNGFLNARVRPIPEPTTALLLIFGAAVARAGPPARVQIVAAPLPGLEISISKSLRTRSEPNAPKPSLRISAGAYA